MTEEPKKRLSLEEIRAALDDIARDASNRDRFKALKMLAEGETSSVTLPEPMGDGEIIERLQRVMKPAAKELVQIAYRRAFPRNDPVDIVSPTLNISTMTEEQQAIVKKCINLKALYRNFPEIKRHGVPTGYPSGRGIEIQQAWCRTKAAKMLIDRDRTEMERVKSEDKGIRDDDPNPPVAA